MFSDGASVYVYVSTSRSDICVPARQAIALESTATAVDLIVIKKELCFLL